MKGVGSEFTVQHELQPKDLHQALIQVILPFERQITLYRPIIDMYFPVIADFPEGFNFTKVKDEENLYQIENNGILSQGNISNCT